MKIDVIDISLVDGVIRMFDLLNNMFDFVFILVRLDNNIQMVMNLCVIQYGEWCIVYKFVYNLFDY